MTRLLLALLLATVALSPLPSAAATYHVDPVAGVDDPGRDATMPDMPWKTIAFTIDQIPAGESHEILLLPGEYSTASGEIFPVRLPSTVSLRGSGSEATVLVDEREFSQPTVIWRAVEPESIAADREVRDLQILRRAGSGRPAGIGLRVWAEDTSASPVLTNLVIRGATTALDLVAFADYGSAVNTTQVLGGSFTNNFWGVTGFAYTYSGDSAAVAPTLTNSVLAENFADGALFETAAAYGLSSGQRARATSAPVLTHCTMAENVGSGLVLYNYNGGQRAGSVLATVRNSVLADNGDYAVLEDTVSTDATDFTFNLVGTTVGLALYLDEGGTPLTSIAQVNAAVGSATNLGGNARFVQRVTSDWHLRADSPGVDAAEPGRAAEDFEGDPRPSDTDGDGTPAPEMGADEADPCAVDAIVVPDTVEPLCGPDNVLQFDASGSMAAAGFACSEPLTFAWYADGELFSTDPMVEVQPTESISYVVEVVCSDFPSCVDAHEFPIVVNELPQAEAGGPYEACIDAMAGSVEIDLAGSAAPAEDNVIEALSWTTDVGLILGGATTRPILVVDQTGENQVVTVSLTATDNNGCEHTDTAEVFVWRGPIPDAGGPYVACQDPESDTGETAIPLTGAAATPAGSSVVAWSWTTSVGRIEGGDTATPSLVLRNVAFSRTAEVTVTTTDDHGCAASDTAMVTLHPAPLASAGGPYQQMEGGGGMTSFALEGMASGGTGALALTWTTDLGTFLATGTQEVMGSTTATLEIVNTGSDQAATVCFQAVDENGCGEPDCTQALVRTSPPQPPNGVGPSFRINATGADVTLRWANPDPDATHDIAETFAVWESTTPQAGGWAVRAGLDAVPVGAGTTSTTDATLRDPAGEDRLFLKVVAQNTAGASCTDPELELPNCP